jgi:O-antigen/teichoic acid export membrane protein
LSKEYVSASGVLRILVLYGVITSMAAFIGSILNGLGKPHQFATMSITSSVIAIVLGIALVPFFGILGASLSLLIGSIFNILLAAYFIKKEQFVAISLTSILKPIISALTAILVGYIALTVVGSMTVTLLLAFVAYLILIITCKVTTKSELKRLLQTVTRITH